MVELMVVVAIIAILAGVLFGSFGGATESARAALCLTNLRALAMASSSAAITGGYPLASSREVYGAGTSEDNAALGYCSQPGWISWLGENYSGLPAHRSGNEMFPYRGTGKQEDADFAFTNGTLWVSTGQNRNIYVCPEHSLYRKRKKLSTPYFSYVMNAGFGWDYTKGAGTCEGTPGVYFDIKFGDLACADKTLLFAEFATVAITGNDGAKDVDNIIHEDCVLQFLDVPVKSKNKDFNGMKCSPMGDAESIGFAHKVGKRRCAHVAFADGHTEKLVWGDGGVDAKTLTAYLCKGWDVTTSAGTGWQLAKDADMPGEEEEEE